MGNANDRWANVSLDLAERVPVTFLPDNQILIPFLISSPLAQNRRKIQLSQILTAGTGDDDNCRVINPLQLAAVWGMVHARCDTLPIEYKVEDGGWSCGFPLYKEKGHKFEAQKPLNEVHRTAVSSSGSDQDRQSRTLKPGVVVWEI